MILFIQLFKKYKLLGSYFFCITYYMHPLHMACEPCMYTSNHYSSFVYLFWELFLTLNALYMQSTVVQGIVTSVNVCALLFVIVAGGYLGFKSGWGGYELPTGYLKSLFCTSSHMLGLWFTENLFSFALIGIFPLGLMGCLLVLQQSSLHM